MSENESGSAAPDAVSDQTQVPQEPVASGGNDAVKYETYKRTLGEAKKYKGLVEELQSKVTNLEQGQLSAEGKKDELIDSLRKQNSDLSGKLNTAVSNFAIGKAKQAVSEEASKLGCNDLGLLTKAIEDRLTGIDYDDSFNPSNDQVRMILDEARQSHPLLFSKSAPPISTHQLNPNSASNGDKSIKELDKEALWAKLAEEHNKR